MENNDDFFGQLKNNPSLMFIFGFLSIILVGATLLNLPVSSADGKSIGFIDALFTAVSSTCVTGLVVVNTAEHWSVFGKVVIIVLIQIGGLGVMTMSALISFFLGKKISLKTRLLIMEERNSSALQGVVKLTRYIIAYTFIMEIAGAVLLSFVFVKDYGWFDGIGFSIFHSISSFCNAGFDLTGNSMVGYVDNPLITFTVSALVIIGGIGFFVLWDIHEAKTFKRLTLHSKLTLIITGILLAAGFVLFFALEYDNSSTIGSLSMSGKIQASIFQSMTPRTAGYNSVDLAGMRMPTVAMMIVLMFIGGSSGSTAGGIKTTTAGVVVVSIYNLICGRRDIEVFKRRISYSLALKAVAVTGIGIMVITVATFVLTITEAGSKFDFLDILFETVSAFGTVGVSRGLTPLLTGAGKLLLACLMFIGRLGPLTVAYALVRENKTIGNYTYPEGKIIIG